MKKTFVCIAATIAATCSAARYFVVPDAGSVPAGAAAEWTGANALTSIAGALSAASAGDEVCLAPGTYGVSATIVVSKQLKFCSGSWGNASVPAERGDVVLDGGGSVQIMRVEAVNVTISDVTFANGYTGDVAGAAAILMTDSGACNGFNVSNCVFRSNNSAGSCIWAAGNESWAIQDCVFSNNVQTVASGTAKGVAIYAQNETTAASKFGAIRNCLFEDNTVTADVFYGGIVCAYKGRIVIEGSSFISNNVSQTSTTAPSRGGIVYTGGNTTMKDCSFTGAAAVNKNYWLYGTVIEFNGAGCMASNCVFSGIVDVSGSSKFGMIHVGDDNMTFLDCRFTGNTLYTNRGLFLENGGNMICRNCLFAGNERKSYNSYLIQRYLNVNKTPLPVGFSMENCTFADNDDDSSTQAINMGSGNSKGNYTNYLVNCVFTQKSLANISTSDGPAAGLIASNCCFTALQDGGPVYIDCFTVPRYDIKFMCSYDGDYRLQRGSPLRDRGRILDWTTASAKDLDGNPRVVSHGGVPLATDASALPDIGCYERQTDDEDHAYEKRLVATAEEKTGDWADAYTDFQTAVDGTPDGWRLLVKPGLYQPSQTVVISNRILEVASCGADGKPDPANTVIDGQGARRVMLVHWGETSTANSDRNPVNWRPVMLEGLTFANGVAAADDGQPFAGNGGGLLFYGRSPGAGKTPSRVVNCRFADCSAVNGGGVALVGGWVENCTFTHCSADYGGGACNLGLRVDAALRINYTMDLLWYSPSFHGCSFIGNTAYYCGGGYSTCTNDIRNGRHTYVADCSFVSNVIDLAKTTTWKTAASALGPVRGSLVTNCTFTGNSGGGYGTIRAVDGAHGVDLVFSGCSSSGGVFFSDTSNRIEFARCSFIEDTRAPSRAVLGCGTFRNSLFVNGSSRDILTQYSYNQDPYPLKFENCTFVNKSGGIINYRNANEHPEVKPLVFVNCILWRAGGASVHATGKEAYNATYATNCCFSAVDWSCGFQTHEDCFVNANPGFADAANGDWSISGRTCREKGVMLPWMTDDAIDLAGNPRVASLYGRPHSVDSFALPDLGCYESQTRIGGFSIIFK